MEFIAFPNSKDVVISSKSSNIKDISVESSGSSGLYYKGKCHQTFPNETLNYDEKMDWCSNFVPLESQDKPWITYSIKNQDIKVTGFSLRNGCCWYDCCCIDDNRILSEYCCCRLYSFSLLGSNDNRTWKTIHKVEKEEKYWSCSYKTYNFEKTQPFHYLRLRLDAPYPGCPVCMQLNEIQFYGETIPASGIYNSFEGENDDESISIIGKIIRNHDE